MNEFEGFAMDVNTLKNYEDKIHYIFLQFCPTGAMDIANWIKFCKDLNLINKKKNFTIPDAHMMFRKASLSKSENTGSRDMSILSKCSLTRNNVPKWIRKSNSTVVHFAVFRYVMLLAIAVRKRVSIDALLRVIVHAFDSKKVKPHLSTEISDTEHLARNSTRYEIKFKHQTERYEKKARRVLKMLGQPTGIKNTNQEVKKKPQYLTAILKRSETSSPEEKLHAIFMAYTGGYNALAMHQFVQMCRLCDLLHVGFLGREAKQVFKNAISLASSPTAGKHFNEGVMGHEFMTYEVFRSFAVPQIVQHNKKMNTEFLDLFI